VGATLRGTGATGSGAVSFTTLRLVYGEALAGFRAGQPNSVRSSRPARTPTAPSTGPA
jgi:hypothetical protein